MVVGAEMIVGGMNANANAVSDVGPKENSGKETKFVDQITLEEPLMDTLWPSLEKGNEDVKVLRSVGTMDKESVNDQVVVEPSLIDLSSMKTKGNEVVNVDVEIMCSKEVTEDPLLELHNPSCVNYLHLVQAGLNSENSNVMVKLVESDSERNRGQNRALIIFTIYK